METLVLKAKEATANSGLRKLNELRFGARSKGTGLQPVSLKLSAETLSVPAKWKVLSGNAYFTTSSGSTHYTELESTGAVKLYVTSGDAVLTCENFDLAGTEFIATTISADNGPIILFNINEINWKQFITNVSLPVSIATGDFSKNGKLETITTGIFLLGTSVLDSSMMYSLEDLAKVPNCNNIQLTRCICRGGDFFKMLSGMNYVNVSITYTDSNMIEHESPSFRCTYVSGVSEIPSFAFKGLSNRNTGKLNKETLLSLMQLLIDGINANKITLENNPGLSLSAAAGLSTDSDVVAKKTTLNGLGVTVTFF